MSLHHLTGDRIIGASVENQEPTYGHTVSGYGSGIPSRYTLTLTDGRTRRVYFAQYGNSGSLYVVVGGEDHYLDGDAERILAIMRDHGETYGQARERLATELVRWGLTTYDVHRES